MRKSREATTAALPRWCAALLLAFVMAQVLGLMHGVVHAGRAAHPPAADHAVAAHGHSGVAALFAQHQDASDCRLLDALNQPGAAAAIVLVTAAPAPVVASACAHAAFVARGAAPFDARGPPASR